MKKFRKKYPQRQIKLKDVKIKVRNGGNLKFTIREAADLRRHTFKPNLIAHYILDREIGKKNLVNKCATGSKWHEAIDPVLMKETFGKTQCIIRKNL